MSTRAAFWFNGSHVASKHWDGYPAGVLGDLVAFLRRDGYCTVEKVFAIVPEFTSFSPDGDTVETDLGETFIPGYGTARLNAPRNMECGEYCYHISPDGFIRVTHNFRGEVGCVNWLADDAYSQAADVMVADGCSDAEFIDYVRSYHDDMSVSADTWLRAFNCGVPLDDIFAG